LCRRRLHELTTDRISARHRSLRLDDHRPRRGHDVDEHDVDEHDVDGRTITYMLKKISTNSLGNISWMISSTSTLAGYFPANSTDGPASLSWTNEGISGSFGHDSCTLGYLRPQYLHFQVFAAHFLV
jgi:hypothetical protein